MNFFIFILLFLLSGSGLLAQERTVTTSDGVQLYVRVAGEGTPLLYVHGGPGSGSLWFEKLSGEFMEKHFTVVYLDQRGVGRSTSPANDDYSLKRMTLDFEEVRRELDFNSWLTLGHSFGGILQMGYAERFPDANLGLIMINGTVSLKESACESWIPKAARLIGEEYSCEGDSVPVMHRMGEYGTKLRNRDLFWKMGSKAPDTFEALNRISDSIENFNYDLSNKIMGYEEYWNNFKPITAGVKVPVLYFYGKNDFLVGPDHFEGLKFPKLLLWENNGGHIPFIEDRADLEQAISDYIRKYNF